MDRFYLKISRTVSRLAWTLGLTAAALVLIWLVFVVSAGPEKGVALLARTDQGRVDAVADARPEATLADARAWPESAWTRWTGSGYLSARHGDVIWLRVTLKNPGDEPLSGVLEDASYFSDRAELWTEHAGGWKREVSGTTVANRNKPLATRMVAFPVSVPARGEQVVYLRAGDHYLAHTQPMWWARSADFFRVKTNHLLVQSMCFGVLLALVFYNAVLWLRMRFEDTGYYLLTAGAGAVCNFIANGGFALVGMPIGSPWHETLIAASMGAGAALMTKFSRVFLGTAESMPRADRWLRGWGTGMVILALLTPAMLLMKTPLGVQALTLATVFTDVICMIAAVAAWRRGAGHARFFLLAFGFLALAGMPMVLSVLREEVGAGVAMGLLIGRTLEMLLLSFAVADRFAQTQRKLFEETEQRRAIEEAYADELAVEVRERTRELELANADKDRMIAVIGHDLRSPLTALTLTAEQISKGPGSPSMEARFVSDASQLGRQMLLLIEDLVLWARLRAGSLHTGEHEVTEFVTPAILLHRPAALRRGVDLITGGVLDGLFVKTDLVLAQTLVRNLTANAVRYAHTRVTVSAERTCAGVRILVCDDGPGLPPAVAARFSPDTPAPDWAGTGLGLRLCVEITRALGARLEVVSARAGRTEFAFTAPEANGKA